MVALFEVGTPFGPATVRFLINSSAVRSPDFSIMSRVIVSTGFAPTSSAVGMWEPVTMIRSVSPTMLGVGEAVATASGSETLRYAREPALVGLGNATCPNAIEATSKEIPAAPNNV